MQVSARLRFLDYLIMSELMFCRCKKSNVKKTLMSSYFTNALNSAFKYC